MNYYPNTEIWRISLKTRIIEKNDLKTAGEIIRSGGLVAFPTETVYGLGANALDEAAVKKIFVAKGRPSDNPLIVHIGDISQIYELAEDINENARKLIDAFMPGPFTIILKKKAHIPDTVTAGLDSVGIRFPIQSTAVAFINEAGVPIAAPSANLSGKPSPTEVKHVTQDMMGRIEGIINGENCDFGVESTIVDATSPVPVLLRPGGVTYDMLCSVVSETIIDKNVMEQVKDNEKPKCPGTKYKHYSPKAQVVVIEGECENVRAKIKELLEENSDKTSGVLTMFNSAYDRAVVINGGENNRDYAKNLFSALRSFDDLGVEIVFAEFKFLDGYGLAVKNRLYKAAGYNIIYV